MLWSSAAWYSAARKSVRWKDGLSEGNKSLIVWSDGRTVTVCHHISGDCSGFSSPENEHFSFICNLLQFLTKGVTQCFIVTL